jgi:signal peptidase II
MIEGYKVMIMIRVFSIALITLLIDQISKFYVVHFLDLKNKLSIDVLYPYFNLRMAWNKGINFGFFSSSSEMSRLFLIGISVLICFILFLWVRRNKSFFPQFCIGLIIGGALGNVFDRIIFGAVADFINMSCCGIVNPFSFNLADVAIFLAAFGLIFYSDNDNKKV